MFSNFLSPLPLMFWKGKMIGTGVSLTFPWNIKSASNLSSEFDSFHSLTKNYRFLNGKFAIFLNILFHQYKCALKRISLTSIIYS